MADKFLVCAALLVLVQLNRRNALVALVIIGREIAISALREWMAQIGASRSVAVHMLGKIKTVVQMVAIPFLLFDGRLFGVIDIATWGAPVLMAVAVLTIWSMVYYLQQGAAGDPRQGTLRWAAASSRRCARCPGCSCSSGAPGFVVAVGDAACAAAVFSACATRSRCCLLRALDRRKLARVAWPPPQWLHLAISGVLMHTRATSAACGRP